MKTQDLREIANHATFERVVGNEKVVIYGEPGFKFYIILKGVVSIQVPNPQIEDWSYHYKHYHTL